jgi:hypothetical protein
MGLGHSTRIRVDAFECLFEFLMVCSLVLGKEEGINNSWGTHLLHISEFQSNRARLSSITGILSLIIYSLMDELKSEVSVFDSSGM